MIRPEYYQEYAYLNGCIYLDVASVAMQPERTLKHCREFQDTFVQKRGRISLNGGFEERRKAVKKTLAELIHCDEEEILLTNNTTEGNSLLATSYNFDRGDKVISASNEHGSVILGWAERQTEGVELQLVPLHNGGFDDDELISMIDGRTKIVALSMVNNNTGYRPDLEKIGRACRERNVIFAVDGIQGLGRQPVDVKKMNIDYLSCGGYKGLLGVFGAGFLYCRKELQPLLRPRYFCESSVEFEQGSADGLKKLPVYSLRSGLQKLEGGAKSTYTISALGVSVDMLLEIGIENIREHIFELEKLFREEVSRRTDQIHFLGSQSPEHWSGNICFTFQADRFQAVKAAFDAHDIIARVHPGDVRIALHYYNTPEQIKTVANVLCEVLR